MLFFHFFLFTLLFIGENKLLIKSNFRKNPKCKNHLITLFSGSLFQKTAPVDPGMDMPSCEFKPEPYEVRPYEKYSHEAQEDVNCRSTNFQ